MTMSSNPEPAVRVERDGPIATIVLNRPDNRNTMTPELLDAFSAAVADVRRDADLRCVVLTGTGPSFCAGADLKRGVQRDDGRLSAERSFAMYAPFLSLRDVEVPVIGALQGHAVGGGFGLAMMCDLRVCNEAARYGANFARLGLASGMAITDLLPRLVGVPRAFELLLTGALIDGATAATWGWCNAAVAGDRVLARARDYAVAIAGAAPIAVRLTKRAVYHNLGWDPREAAWREAWVQAATIETADCGEGVRALLDKREPRFEGR